MKVFFNNEYREDSEIGLSIDNRGFNYGDGIFETIMATENEIRFLEDHILRLKNALNTLKLSIPDVFHFSELSKIINELRNQNHHKGISRIKIQIWRKAGGLFSPTNNEAEFLITAIDGSFNLSPRASVTIYNEFRLSPSPISQFKKLSSLQYVLGGIYKSETKADDIIFLDTEGNVAECLASNIFWSKGDTIFTPSLETGCIDGIMRKQIKKFIQNKGIKFNEGKFLLNQLLESEFVFISNVAGINVLKKIEKTEFITEPIWFKDLQTTLMF